MKKYLLFISLSFFFFNFCIAQTGPGGIKNSTNNIVWLNASKDTLIDNAKVGTMTDFSGNNNRLVQGANSNKPTFKKNIINNQSAYYFNGNNFISSSPIAALNNKDISYFVVFKSISNATSQFIFNNVYSTGAGASSNVMWGATYAVNHNKFNTYSRASSGAATSCLSNYNTNFNFINGNWNLTTNEYLTYFNSNFACLKTGSDANPNGHSYLNVGSRSSTTAMFTGYISELIVFNSLLNNTEKTIIENYLGNKYNISFSGDMYAYQNTHQFEIAGIGQTSASDNHLNSKGSATVRIFNPSSITNGSFLFWGHNNDDLTIYENEAPPSVTDRYKREWRVSKTGTIGTVSVEFNVSTDTLAANQYVLLIDSDGDGNFSNASLSSIVTPSGGKVVFNNIALNDGDFFTLGNVGNIKSVANGSWQTPATWNCNCIPTITSNVTIKTPHNIAINGQSFSKDLLIENGSNLTFNAANLLSVAGNFTNNGNVNFNNGAIEFAGNTPQIIKGTSNNNFSSIIINNISEVKLRSNSSFIGTLQIAAGTFSADSSMTLLSNATQTGNIASIPVGSNIFGNFIIQRYIPGGNAYWDNLSSPVVGAKLSDWDDELVMSVPGGKDGIAYGGGTLQYSVKSYSEPTSKSTDITTITHTLGTAEGFQVFLGDNKTTFSAKTFDTRGTPNQGTINKPLSYSGAGKGFNLVGNPYASNINWFNVFYASQNIKNEYYVYDKTIKSYAMWNGATSSGTGVLSASGGIIPSSQGFLITATALPSAIVFNEFDKTNATTVWTKPAKQSFAIDFKVHEKNNIYGGQAKLISSSLATDGVDDFDGGYIENSFDEDSPNLYFETENNKMLISLISTNGFEKHFNLFVKANKENTLVLNADIFSNDENYSCIYLEDKSNNKIIDLTQTNSYEFAIENKNERKQFVLHLYKANQICDANQPLSINSHTATTNVVFINSNEDVGMIINSKKPETAVISVTNVLGQEVVPSQKTQINEPTKILLNLPQTNSIYIIKVEIEGKVVTNKVIR